MFKSKGRTNCPNCGAPIEGEKCEHCGTMFYDFGALEIGKLAYFKFILNGMVFMFKGIADADVTAEPNMLYMELNDETVAVMRDHMDITVKLTVRALQGIDGAPIMQAMRVND